MVLRAGLKRVELHMKNGSNSNSEVGHPSFTYTCTHTHKCTLYTDSHLLTHTHTTQSHTHLQHSSMELQSLLSRAHTHTQLRTFSKSPLHGFTQYFHLWVALYCSDDVTDGLKDLFSALLHQSPVQELVTLPRLIKLCQLVLITLTDTASVKKFPNDSISIHFLNELVPKEIKYLYSFMEREDTWYTNLITC